MKNKDVEDYIKEDAPLEITGFTWKVYRDINLKVLLIHHNHSDNHLIFGLDKDGEENINEKELINAKRKVDFMWNAYNKSKESNSLT